MINRNYLLGVLVAFATLNQLDRQLMAILLEPIRQEFSFSDIELGLLSGAAFAVLYAALSIPAAVWAVRGSRRNLIAAAGAVWGATTLLIGFAQSFWQLLLGRIGTGIGEAGAMPASHSIISDLYAPHERAGAMSVWAMGSNLGVFAAFLIGGYIGHRYGWRAAFISAGFATCVVSLLTFVTVREPERQDDARSAALRQGPSVALLREAVTIMWSDSAIRHTVIGSTIIAVISYGAVTWLPSFLLRSHGLTLPIAGAYLAVVIGLGGAFGTYIGGRLTDRLRRRDIGWSLWFVALVYLATRPFSIYFYLSSDTVSALAAFILPAMVGALYLGPAIAVLHNRISPALRPAVSAIFLMLVNLIGLGLGPVLVGMMSEWLFGYSPNALGLALATLQIGSLWGSAHFLIAGLRLSRAERASAENAV